MVKTQKFTITLADEKEVYNPGDEVTGQLEIGLDEEIEMKEIRIKFAGKAHVFFSQGKDSNFKTENFFSESVVVHGEGAAEDERVSLSAGVHKFPFQFRLPQPLATSYEDFFGYIRYYVKARIVKPWQIDEKTVTVITVLDQLDLNQLENMTAPSSGSKTKSLCCWCCASGPIEGEVRVNRRGYVPGEWIVANATLENNSSSLVRETSLEFVKIVTYYAEIRQKTVVKSLAKEMGPPCNQGQTVNLNNIKLQIPPVPPSEAKHCSIIDIQYAVMLMGHMRKFAFNFRAYAPITVGTIPLRSLQQYKEPTGGEGATETGPSATSSTTFGIQAPPPSYVAATSESFVGAGKSKNATPEDVVESPKYTFYDWNQSAFSYN